MRQLDDDTALVDAALKGSIKAWEKLVRRYEDRIFNQGLRLTANRSDAMDLMQEVFLGVYRNLHRFRGDAKFSSWIFRIAHNKAIDMNRRKRLMPFAPNFIADIPDFFIAFLKAIRFSNCLAIESATKDASVSGFLISLISSDMFLSDNFDRLFLSFSISAPFLPIRTPGLDV